MAEGKGDSLVGSLRASGVLTSLDWHFARTLVSLSVGEVGEVLLAAAMVSRAVSQGHVCLDLRHLTGQSAVRSGGNEMIPVEWPELAMWRESLRESSLVTEINGEPQPEDVRHPLVLEGDRLYTRRYWLYESELAARLNARAVDVDLALSDAEAAERIECLFGPVGPETDWQRVAAAVALTRRLCVITGGPGTGKTHVVANLLAVLAEDERRRRDRLPEVLVLAPTGKAANRISESLAASASRLDCAEDVRALVAAKASTIHRALGRDLHSRSGFRHRAGSPLPADVVIVDEASMVDIALMSKLLAAIPAAARVVLLGDRDQLASVEAGAILADVCGEVGDSAYSAQSAARIEKVSGGEVPRALADTPPIADSIVHLRRNYRYGGDSGIGRLASAINAGDEKLVLDILNSDEGGAVELRPSLENDASFVGRAVDAMAPLFEDTEPTQKLAFLSRFRILCAVRRGPFGVEALNLEIESRLRGQGSIEGDVDTYPGRPLMVRHNDAETGLFNGDVGIFERCAEGSLRAYFPEPDGGEAREVSLGRLPAHETVYAMTIHKSQGSEFEEVAIVLPNRPSPILTRELLYTAVTRARSKVTIYAAPEIVQLALRQRVERTSGLGARLGWQE